MPDTFWTDERVAMLRKLWGTMPTADIGKRLGTTKNAVIGKANRLGLENMKPRARLLQKDDVVALRREGVSRRNIAIHCRVSLSTVESALARWQIPLGSHPDAA